MPEEIKSTTLVHPVGDVITVPAAEETVVVQKKDIEGLYDAVKELTKEIGSVKAQMKTLEETSAKWWRAQKGF